VQRIDEIAELEVNLDAPALETVDVGGNRVFPTLRSTTLARTCVG
jgi:hypothetical protein